MVESDQSFGDDAHHADHEPAAEPMSAGTRPTGLSYKFQRLREKLRAAITSGEFVGKLPGERQLAKRFHVNAKTLSKALTDLAAEGLLDRSIGRGTYVKGSAPAAPAESRWLVLCDAAGTDSAVARHLKQVNPETTFCTDFAQIRPSYLNPFGAVIDLGGVAPEAVVRDLVVRALPLVAIGAEPKTFAMHCVTPDATLAATKLGRDLLIAGHRRLVAVEAAGRTGLTQALRQAVARYAPDAVVDTCTAQEVATLLGDGAVAFVCESVQTARQARATIADHATTDVALAAVGYAAEGEAPCSGYYADPRQLADAAVNLLRDPPARPATLWLTCQWVDRATMTGPATAASAAAAAIEAPAALRIPQFASLPA